jgi:hypothetical protein
MEQQNVVDDILEDVIEKPKRSAIVTIICILYFCFVLLIIPTLFRLRHLEQSLAFWLTIAFLTIMTTFLIAMWKNMRWGIYGFVGINLLILLGTIIQQPFRPLVMPIPLICSIFLIFQLKNMK